MRGKPHKPFSSSRKMTEQELEIAQWRIDVTAPGEWKIDEIYGQEIWIEQPDKKVFGGVFKKAVVDKHLKHIRLKTVDGCEILSSDGQLLYIVKQ